MWCGKSYNEILPISSLFHMIVLCINIQVVVVPEDKPIYQSISQVHFNTKSCLCFRGKNYNFHQKLFTIIMVYFDSILLLLFCDY